jgi:SAM-dependent methyltransferase
MSEDRQSRYRRWRDNSAPYFRWQVAQFAPFLGRRLADVGCGPGTLAPFLAQRELYVGVDNDAALLQEVEALREEFPGIRTLQADVTDDATIGRLRELNIDTILSANTIEHIENDRQALRVMAGALPPGGHLCLLVPAFPMLYGTLDRLDGHYRRYTRGALPGLLEGIPLVIRKMHYFNMLGALGWWVKGRLLRNETQTVADFRIMSMLVPVLRPVEAMIHPPIGLSLIAILQRQ